MTRRTDAPASSRPLTVYFSVGDHSGDLHAANLIRALRAEHRDVKAVGFGGPKMAEAGCQLHADLTQLAVMWFLRAILNLGTFYRLVCQADRFFRHQPPDAVVLIDFPGFNWWIARRARQHGIPVFYYTPPQIWAWGSWRVKKMRRDVNHVLCALPFEEKWFRERGCHATFVGHPFFDEVREHRLDQAFIEQQRARPGRLVAILPGSRTQEVELNLRWFLLAAKRIHQQAPDVRFAIAAFRPLHADYARRALAGSDLPIDIFVRKTPELMHLAHSCMAVSGSVSLELLYHTKPTVILYHVSRLAIFVQSFFLHVKYITLVNLLGANQLYPSDRTRYDANAADADEALFPEYLTAEDKSEQIAGHILQWLSDEPSRQALIARLENLKAEVAHGGASSQAARQIMADLGQRPRVVPRPHFRAGQTTANLPTIAAGTGR